MSLNTENSTRPGLLLLDRFNEMTEVGFEGMFSVHRSYRTGFSLEEIGPCIKAVATSGGRGAPAAIVERLPALEIIAIRGVGTDGVDLERARQKNVHVTTTPNLLTEDVADFAVALLLATSRSVCTADRFVRDGQWGVGVTLPLGRKVTGMRIGIVGLGKVGRAIAGRLNGFNVRISYTDINEFEDVYYKFVADIRKLAAESDALILAASGGLRSYQVVDAVVLEALGPQGILINVARGSLVDEEALVAALKNKKLGGAGLDVFVDEPHVPPALLGLDNVVLQPHRASATYETRMAMENLVLENLRAHFSGQPLPTPVL